MANVFDDLIAAQKRGETKGMTSVCSAHPFVIQPTLRVYKTLRVSPSIETTCNQVNQFGGYTGMTPKDFFSYIRGIAEENDFPFENIVLGGDHLGPNVWQNESAESAMDKSNVLIRNYVQAGFVKIHLDCSMRLADDPPGASNPEVIARRVAQLAKAAETAKYHSAPQSVIGTEVPIPGGAQGYEDVVNVTKVEDVRETIEVHRKAFYELALQSAWDRVIAVVVQPGVEFGDDFVLPYQSEVAKELSRFIESESMVYEAHSTDYQTRDALRNLCAITSRFSKLVPA